MGKEREPTRKEKHKERQPTWGKKESPPGIKKEPTRKVVFARIPHPLLISQLPRHFAWPHRFLFILAVHAAEGAHDVPLRRQ